jgi:voltage-gated potassium channel
LRNAGEENLQKRVVFSLFAIFFIVFVVGPVGYMLIEKMDFNQALYMTVITVFTVGFKEVKELSTGGQYFTIFIIFFGVLTLFFIISSLIEYTFREALSETLGRRRMDLRIRKLEGHHIVCGYGRVGEVVCETLHQAGADFVVIDKDPERTALASERGMLCISGDATESGTLEAAGVRRAAGLVCALQSDAENLFATLTARSLNPDLVIVSRCVNPESVDKLRYAGADRIVSPYSVSGRRMAVFLLRPGVYDYLDLVAHGSSVEYRLEELLVEKESPLVGKTIGEADIKARTGALIIGIRKKESGEFNTNPDKNTLIEEGDLLIALGREVELAELEELVVAPSSGVRKGG